MTKPATDTRPAIAAAIIVAERKVLMVRRRVAEGQLSWQFPAGEVEPGETGEQAAVRETKEEVGLTVTATRRIAERVHPDTGRSMVYVACEVVEGNARVADQHELDAVEWCDRTTLREHVPHPLFQPVHDYLSAELEQPQSADDHRSPGEADRGATR